MSEQHPVLRLALALCPREFRDEYAAQIQSDAAERRNPYGESMAAVRAGCMLRLEDVWRDVTFALRALAKVPLYTTVVVATIAVAIAANVAVGSVLEAVLLRPLPYPNPARLVFVAERQAGGVLRLSYPDAVDVRHGMRTLAVLGVARTRDAVLSGMGPPIMLHGRVVDDAYFRALQVPPMLGRSFGPADLGTNRIIVSAKTARRLFRTEAAALGKILKLADDGWPEAGSYTIVGVMPDGFRDPAAGGLPQSSFWRAMNPRSRFQAQRGSHNLFVVGRLNDAVTLDAVRSDLSRVMESLLPTRNSTRLRGRISAVVEPLSAEVVGGAGTLLSLLSAAAALVLLVACANVANLALARAATREGEFVVRSALGASRSRIVRQLATESVLLGAAAGTLGMGLAVAALRAFNVAGAALFPRWESVAFDAPMFLYAAGLIALVVLCTGIVPGLLLRRDLAPALKSVGRADERSFTKRLRSAFVVAEVAFALALTVCAGLTLRSFVTLTSTPLGFTTADVSIGDVNLAGPRYADVRSRIAFAERILPQLQAIPGIAHVGLAGAMPFSGYNGTSFSIPGRPRTSESVQMGTITPDYFAALRIPLLRGRAFGARDTFGARQVAIVNAAFARRYFGTLDVVGRQVAPEQHAVDGQTFVRTIVGVVGDVHYSLGGSPAMTVYAPIAQIPDYRQVVVEARGPLSAVAAAVSQTFARVDPSLLRPQLVALDASVAEDALERRSSAALFGVLAFVALALALGGIYGVTAYSVARRTHEFGIRRALGARGGAVLASVLRRAAAQSAAGCAFGIALAAGGSRFLTSLLFNVSPLDLPAFAGAIAVIAGCTLGAALLPAARAVRVGAATALRYE